MIHNTRIVRYATSAMTSLSSEDISHIAKLCRLNIPEDQKEQYARELTNILSFVEQLQEVDTSHVEPASQVTGRENVFRDDCIRSDAPHPDALLDCSPLPIVDHQIQTPSAHG